MQRQILLFGGAFDPPHLGHRLVINQALEQISPDELWLMPMYGSTFGKQMSSVADRLAMVKLFIKDIDDSRVKLSTFEIDHHLTGSTWETYNLLNADYELRPTSYGFLMGSDQLASFTKWKNWDQLLQKMQFYVYPREGYPLTPWYPDMIRLNSPEISSISSTDIRKKILDGQNPAPFLTPSVMTHFEEQKTRPMQNEKSE